MVSSAPDWKPPQTQIVRAVERSFIPLWLTQVGSLAGLATLVFTVVERIFSGRPRLLLSGTVFHRYTTCANRSSEEIYIRSLKTYPGGAQSRRVTQSIILSGPLSKNRLPRRAVRTANDISRSFLSTGHYWRRTTSVGPHLWLSCLGESRKQCGFPRCQCSSLPPQEVFDACIKPDYHPRADGGWYSRRDSACVELSMATLRHRWQPGRQEDPPLKRHPSDRMSVRRAILPRMKPIT